MAHFSLAQRIKSFDYAIKGLKALLQTEHNARIHLAATIVVLMAGYFLLLSAGEWIALLIVISMVWITELINTAIEKTMDFISTERHPQIGQIKDLAAAAVLIASICAALTGLFIFIPKLIGYASSF
jgi:diacylglycerol kinase (ATP)